LEQKTKILKDQFIPLKINPKVLGAKTGKTSILQVKNIYNLQWNHNIIHAMESFKKIIWCKGTFVTDVANDGT
jgi:hypothetical protein